MISSRTQCPVDNKIRAPKSTESKRVQDAINELIIWKLNSLVVVVMTSQFTRDIDYPRYEISTGSVFLNLIYCNVFIAILSIACMTGALWAKRGERDISRDTSARRGEEKNKAPVRSPLFLLFRTLTPTNINYPRWCQKNQSKLSHENCHLSGAKRLHCSRNEELRLFPWLRELPGYQSLWA